MSKLEKETVIAGMMLVPPTGVFVDMLLHLKFTRWDVTILNIYALFLCGYLLWIFAIEYWRFRQLHKLKSPAVDFILLAIIFVAIREFGTSVLDVRQALLSIVVLLSALVAWEVLTMIKGYRNYFGATRQSLRMMALWMHFACAIGLRVEAKLPTHWDEYRYWVILDGVLLILALGAYIVLGWLVDVPDIVVRFCIFVIGFYVGFLNIWRYTVVLKGASDSAIA